MQNYFTKNNLLVTAETLNIFRKYVYSVPLIDCSDKRKEPSYRKSIASFLEHLICSATISKNTQKRAHFKGNTKWTYSVPIPFKMGMDSAPHVFKQTRNLNHSRALELLEEFKLIKIVKANNLKKLCREFALSKKFLNDLFPIDRGLYLKKKNRYFYLSDIFLKKTLHNTIFEIMESASRKTAKPKHGVTFRQVSKSKAREFIISTYDNINPIQINLDALIEYCNKEPSHIKFIYFHNFIRHLKDVGVKIVNQSPLIVEYKQSYKVASVGSHSFEIGTGFQYLPRGMKWACLAKGFNYDIKGCQLEILKDELRKIGVPKKYLKCLETDFILKKLKISDNLVKKVRFATMFNAGSVCLSYKSGLFKSLLSEFKDEKLVIKLLGKWKKHTKTLEKVINKLIDHYLSTGKTNRYGKCVENAVGQNFNCTYKNYAERKKWNKKSMRRKLLAHMIQGIESKAVYDFVSNNKHVCALEHDGFISLRKVDIKTKWLHPYLKIVLKNEALRVK